MRHKIGRCYVLHCKDKAIRIGLFSSFRGFLELVKLRKLACNSSPPMIAAHCLELIAAVRESVRKSIRAIVRPDQEEIVTGFVEYLLTVFAAREVYRFY